MAVFGAPFPQEDHALRAAEAAMSMHGRQAALNATWEAQDLEPFGLGIGLSTGEVAAALLGSPERLEYTVVGDTVNMAQRLQELARPAGTTVLSEQTVKVLGNHASVRQLELQLVKGRDTPVQAFAIDPNNGGD
jgi:class 3 adenylate cyclase